MLRPPHALRSGQGVIGTGLLALGLLLAFMNLRAAALVNASYTPGHMAKDCEQLLVVEVVKVQEDRLELKLVRKLKGEAGDRILVSLSKAEERHAELARKTFGGPKGPVLLAAKAFQENQLGYLHHRGVWFRLIGTAKDRWVLDEADTTMAGTWNGGTDMLIRCLDYILESNDTIVPVASGNRWRTIKKMATFEGPVPTLRAIDLAGDGRLSLFAASPLEIACSRSCRARKNWLNKPPR